MTKVLLEERTLDIPEGVTVDVSGAQVTVRGPLGNLSRDFSHLRTEIKLENGKLIVRRMWPKRRDIAAVGTLKTHIGNMVRGVTKGFTYKLKVVSSHFPITVKVAGNLVLIENFIGERSPRKVKILEGTKVTAKGDDIVVQGIDLLTVSQTAASIQNGTRIRHKDSRVFLDGIYVYHKSEGT